MRHSIPVSLFSLLIPVLLAAQTPSPRQIAGTVINDANGDAIAGATVRAFIVVTSDSLAPTKLGAVAGAGGRFTLRLPADSSYVIEVSSIGFTTRRVPLAAGMDSITIELAEKAHLSQQVQIRAARRTRSVEDACCRVESIREEVQQHAPFSPSAVDVLRRYSSCTSTRTLCALDNSQSIRLRGLEPTYINVLVDGMPAISGLGTVYGLGMIPAHALQTIRIAEGASSSLYGNGAVSGVVDLQTRQPTEVAELTVTGNVSDHQFGMPGERDLNVSYTELVGDVGLAAFGSVNSHNREERAIPGTYERFSGLVKGNALLDGATEITAAALAGRETREGRVLGPVEASERVRTERADLSLKAAHTFEDESEIQASTLLSMTGVDASYIGRPLDASQRIAYANATYLRTLGDHMLTAGVEIRDDRLSVATGPAIGYTTTVASGFLQDEIPLGDLWTVMGSLRVDNHADAGTIVSPRGSIKLEPMANMTMRLMAGQGFKGQALFDEQPHRALHGDYRWLSNTALDFERSFTLNYDISYSFVLGDQFGVDANFNTYHTTIDGKVIPHADSMQAGTLFMINSDEPTRLQGLELQLRPSYGEHWSGSIALSVIDYRMRSADGVYERIPLAPSFNLDMSVMYHDRAAGLNAELWGSHVGAQRLPSNPFGLAESSPYTVFNARVEKSFGTFAAYVGVNNLLGATQEATMPLVYTGESGVATETVWGPTEGAEAFVGFRWTLAGTVE